MYHKVLLGKLKPVVSQSDSPFIRETSRSIAVLRFRADRWEMQAAVGPLASFILQFPPIRCWRLPIKQVRLSVRGTGQSEQGRGEWDRTGANKAEDGKQTMTCFTSHWCTLSQRGRRAVVVFFPLCGCGCGCDCVCVIHVGFVQT